MKTLINTSLFNLFTAYINGTERAVEELPAAYENFVDLLAELPQEEDLMKRLRRLNYTKIELAFMQRICNDMPEEQRHVLYDVFIGKALALLDAEAEMIKDSFRQQHNGWIEDGDSAGKQWQESCHQTDLERHGQRPDRTGGGTDGCRSDRDGGRQGVESGGCHPGI